MYYLVNYPGPDPNPGRDILLNMSLFIASLNSGSNGNCYYIGTSQEAIWVDAGLSCRETEKRMSSLGLDPGKIKAIFISHEHTDHIAGLDALLSKYRIPYYMTPGTLRNMKKSKNDPAMRPLVPETEIHIGNLQVTAFKKHHDAGDPVSFIIRRSDTGVTVGVLTDIGSVCENVIKYFSACHAAFLESNYDHAMLMNGQYPWYLKKRISGEKGHLSNDEALQLFRENRAPFMSHLILSHLSAENNCPNKVRELFGAESGSVKIDVALRTGPGLVYKIEPAEKNTTPAPLQPVLGQMKLF